MGKEAILSKKADGVEANITLDPQLEIRLTSSPTVLPEHGEVANLQTREAMSEEVVKSLLENESSLDAYLRVYAMIDVLERALVKLKEVAISKVTEKRTLHRGAIIELRRKVEYDYGDDPQLKGLTSALAELKERITDWKKIRRLSKVDLAEVSTGQIIPPPKVVVDGLQIAITLPNK
jgi:hypothetical protein